MKTRLARYSLALALLTTALWLAACKKDKNDPDINALAYAPSATPQGITYVEWTKKGWAWAMSSPCSSNPVNDVDGSRAGNNQSGAVFFLAGTSQSPSLRTITIPAGKEIFFPVFNVIYDYPCPDTSFHPAPGESLEHLLVTGAATSMDKVSKLEVTLDGAALKNPETYRFATELYYFTGNPDLANCFDPCITGTSQAGVSDGYWVMLKALSKGAHQLHFHGEVTEWGWVQDLTYKITVE